MADRENRFHNGVSGAALAVRVIPRSSRNELVGMLTDGTLKVRITAAPVDGQANAVLKKYFSEILDVSLSSIEIVGGHTGKNKLIMISGLTSNELDRKVAQLLSVR